MALNAYLRKGERPQVHNLSSYSKNIEEKKTQSKKNGGNNKDKSINQWLVETS